MNDNFKKRLIRDLIIFFGASFLLTWGIAGLYIFNMEWAKSSFGEMRLGHPAFYLMVYTPSLSAIIISAILYGKAGLKDIFSSVVRLKINIKWMFISSFGFIGLCLIAALVKSGFTGGISKFDFSPWLANLPLLLLGGHLLKDPGALGEELGWRGFVLPRLLMFFDARSVSILLGFIWAIWHLPAFFISSLSQSHLQIIPFVLRVMSFSIFMTWIFVNARGSVFWAGIIPHMLFNVSGRAGIHIDDIVVLAAVFLILLLSGRNLSGIGKAAPELPQGQFLKLQEN